MCVCVWVCLLLILHSYARVESGHIYRNDLRPALQPLMHSAFAPSWQRSAGRRSRSRNIKTRGRSRRSSIAQRGERSQKCVCYLTRVGVGPWVAHLQSTCVLYLLLSPSLSVLLSLEILIYLPLFLPLLQCINRCLIQRRQSDLVVHRVLCLTHTIYSLLLLSLCSSSSFLWPLSFFH